MAGRKFQHRNRTQPLPACDGTGRKFQRKEAELSGKAASLFCRSAGRIGRSIRASVAPRIRRSKVAVANIKSAIKRNRQNEKRRLANRAVRAELRTRTRSVLEAAEAGADDTDEKLKAAIKRIDMAASKGTMHKNTAARTKSRLVKRVRTLQES